MRVAEVLFARGLGGYFYDDQRAIRAGATRDGGRYLGEPATPGFPAIRVPASTIGIGLRMASGHVTWGDAMSVQYPGAGGRDAILAPDAYLPDLRTRVGPAMVGLDVQSFRHADAEVSEILRRCGIEHRGIDYGMSQALVAASAAVNARTIAETLCDEYGLPLTGSRVPILSQSGEDRRSNVDKMIAKRADILPHGLVNAPDLVGPGGERLLDYTRWVRDRIVRAGTSDYRPTVHLDVYGMLNQVLGEDPTVLQEFLADLARAAEPFPLLVEQPVYYDSRERQLAELARLRTSLTQHGTPVRIVADEWCNTVDDVRVFAQAGACDVVQIKVPDIGSLADTMEAVLACKEAGVGAYLGGSCTETDVSARVCVHVAVAAQAEFQLAKPGMGVDEALMIVRNEQERLVELLRVREGKATAPLVGSVVEP